MIKFVACVDSSVLCLAFYLIFATSLINAIMLEYECKTLFIRL